MTLKRPKPIGRKQTALRQIAANILDHVTLAAALSRVPHGSREGFLDKIEHLLPFEVNRSELGIERTY